jgi:aminopeptidase N
LYSIVHFKTHMNPIHILFSFIFFWSISIFAQTQVDEMGCAAKYRSSSFKMKSNNLTSDQLKESQKYDVHFYALDLTVSNLNTSISGTVEIHAKAIEYIDSALFELHENYTISAIRLNGIPVNFTRKNTAVKAEVNVPQNDFFVLSIDYAGQGPDTKNGKGLNNGFESNWNKQITWTLSEPFQAYHWYPCKQALTDKADSCSVKLTVPSNCKAGSNGVLENVLDLGNGNTRFEWKHRHPIDYYLISLAVGEYTEYATYAHPSQISDSILIQNFIYDGPGAIDNYKDGMDETIKYMELFSDLFGIYPYADEKYGHCLAPMNGGMEHQTMTTQVNFNQELTAHELAHQWWGNYVTCGSWSDIWINEGFATFAALVALEHLYPIDYKNRLNQYHSDVLSQTDGSIWVADSLNPSRIFDGRLTYKKGALFIQTLRYLVNNDALFYQGLQNFQTTYANSTAVGLDLKHELELVSGIDLTKAFEEWYFGEGYPTYSVLWNTNETNLFIQLKQTGSSETTPYFTTPLEISFIRNGLPDTTFRFNLNQAATEFNITGMGNVTNVRGIDPENWILNREGPIIYDPCIGFDDYFTPCMEEQVLIYPNPSLGVFEIYMPQDGMYKMKLYDSKGKLCVEKEFENSTSLDLSKKKKGIFLIQIESSKETTVMRRLITL